MIKNFRVNVNGSTYDVSVEELSEGSLPADKVQQIAPVHASAPVAVEPAPAVQPAHTADASTGESFNVLSPLPGSVWEIKVAVGDKVSPNQVVIVLESMKMESEIITNEGGTVQAIKVTKGDTVNTEDVLVIISK